MVKSRRFKALCGNENYPRLCEKIAFYDDNGKQTGCYTIYVNKDGYEHYYPDNPYAEDGLFYDSLHDVYQCLKDGIIDTFTKYGMLSVFPVLYGIRYIDREYGEKIRQLVLKSFESVKLGYIVNFKGDHVTYGSINNNKYIRDCDKSETKVFDTKEEANKFIAEIEGVAQKIEDEFHEITDGKNFDTDDDRAQIVKDILDKYCNFDYRRNYVPYIIFYWKSTQPFKKHKFELKDVVIVK